MALIEIGGTVGDIGSPCRFIETSRQFAFDVDAKIASSFTLRFFLTFRLQMNRRPGFHLTHSVKELLSQGIQPDILVCRTEIGLNEELKRKIALFCNVPKNCVFENKTLKVLYDVPLALEEQSCTDLVCERFGFGKIIPDLVEWKALSYNLSCPKDTTTIALVGKYVALHDAYLSVVESLTHAGAFNHTKVKVKWVEADDVSPETAPCIFEDVDGILVPGGFGTRKTEGMIESAKFARENKGSVLRYVPRHADCRNRILQKCSGI